MKRLYFITDSLDSAESICNDIHDIGISDHDFHVMSHNEAGLYRRHIHSSNIYHDNNIIRQAERGGLLGALMGSMIVISGFFIPGLTINLMATIGLIGFLMLIGIWFGGFIGIQQENYKIIPFHDKLEQGGYLVMVDVTPSSMSEVEGMMLSKHTEATPGGKDSTLILPF